MTLKLPSVTFELAGVNALLVRFGDELNPALPAFFKAFRNHLLSQYEAVIEQIVPAYTTLLITYDPRQCRMYDLQLLVERELNEVKFPVPVSTGRCLKVPVIYGGKHGSDLAEVAAQCGLSESKVIELHSSATYEVFALGFAPGFGYLGPVHESLRLPRRSSPRARVAAGSVAIAEQQTSVYPSDSPAGWHILGYSPVRWFNPEATPMTPLQVGDQVQFVAMSEQQVEKWLQENPQ